MSNWLTPISETAKSGLNIIKSIGPLLISQSDQTSEAYTRHLSRLATVESWKELVQREIEIYGKVKGQLLQRYIDADEVERIRIKRDLEDIASNMRHLGIVDTAINYLPAAQKPVDQVAENQETLKPEQQVISPHWLDKFNEFARARNEAWRANLLAHALATESTNPGTVSPRALWLLGTLEEHLFKAFATILDLSSVVGTGLMVPISDESLMQKEIPNCEFGEHVSIGNLVYLLSDIGVLSASLTTQRTFPQGSRFSVVYNSHRYHIECFSNALNVRGIIPTLLGSSIASFYQPNFNRLGEEIVKAWLDSLDKNQFFVVKV